MDSCCLCVSYDPNMSGLLCQMGLVAVWHVEDLVSADKVNDSPPEAARTEAAAPNRVQIWTTFMLSGIGSSSAGKRAWG
jgi:hypothetical protein